MKITFPPPPKDEYHSYCVSCHGEKISRVEKEGRTYFYCDDCQKNYDRSLVFDPNVPYWIDDKGEYWHNTAGIFLKDRQNRFLFFERTVFPFAFTVPAGHVDKDEAPLSSAIRELEEEVGITEVELTLFSTDDIVGDVCSRGSDAHRWYSFIGVVSEFPKIHVKEEGGNPRIYSISEALTKDLTLPVKFILQKYRKKLDSF